VTLIWSRTSSIPATVSSVMAHVEDEWHDRKLPSWAYPGESMKGRSNPAVPLRSSSSCAIRRSTQAHGRLHLGICRPIDFASTNITHACGTAAFIPT
jgi:hypothetical protein